ncbi:MAG: MBL fold metallo-hydrolase, partial [Chloroflexi bacterium]|nr:MBL fold metallo-hydrolase [Chloroflexota bacterium]
MELAFLGGATTVTGSQFLLSTGRARVVVDCGMFQGSPSETARNRVPFAFSPREIDALVLTHAHLDHCGLLPLLVAEGYRGPIVATKGTEELAALVLMDSAKLQAESVERNERRDPRRVAV